MGQFESFLLRQQEADVVEKIQTDPLPDFINMISVFHYLNYRTFLKDVYAEKKHQKSSYSYRVFNKASGIKSPSLYKQICDGTRDLTETTIKQFNKGLGLDARSALFFATLVHFNQARNADEKNTHYQKLCHFKEYNQIRKIKAEQFDFFFHWYNLAIFELTKLLDFKEDPKWIARKLRNAISEEQALASLQFMKELQLLRKDEKTKRLKAADKNLATDPDVLSIAVAKFHQSMIEKAQQSLMQDHYLDREISGITIALDEKGFLEAKKRIYEFLQELNVLLSATPKPDCVYQMNFQLFPLTNRKGKLS